MSKDLRLAVGFLRHHKTQALRRLLGADAVLALVGLWSYAAESRPSGELDGMTPEDVEAVAGWTGQPGALFAALVQTRFVDKSDDGACVSLHKWRMHQPWIVDAPRRSRLAAKAAKCRWGADAPRMRPACGPHATRNAGAMPLSSPLLSSLDNPPSPLPGGGAVEAPADKRKPGPQDQVARDLAARLGSSLNPCRKQIAALLAAGRDLDWIRGALEDAQPGMAPWDWTRLVLAPRTSTAVPCADCGAPAEAGGTLCPKHANLARGVRH